MENKYYSGCSYPLTPEGYEETKEQENLKFRGKINSGCIVLQCKRQSYVIRCSLYYWEGRKKVGDVRTRINTAIQQIHWKSHRIRNCRYSIGNDGIRSMAALDAILRNPRRRQVEYGPPTICLCNNSRDRSSDGNIHYLRDDSILYHYQSRTPTKHEMNIPHFIASKA